MLFTCTLPHFILQIKARLVPEHIRTVLCWPSFLTAPVLRSNILPVVNEIPIYLEHNSPHKISCCIIITLVGGLVRCFQLGHFSHR